MKNRYYKKKVLITGHNGFKGKWLCLWLNKLGATILGISLKKNKDDKFLFNKKNQIKSIYQDINDYKKLKKVINNFNPDIIFHLAAQSIVHDSYIKPIETYKTNIMGTLNVFEASRSCKNLKAIVNVTSDKCYLNEEKRSSFKEIDKLGGNDLYSSSKACSEILTHSYRNSFLNLKAFKTKHKILISSVRCGNVVGGGDYNKYRIIPDIVNAINKNKILNIRNPNSIRPWIYILDCLHGYLSVGRRLLESKKEFAQPFNFGPSGENNLKVKDIVKLVEKKWCKIKIKVNKKEKFQENKVLKLNNNKAKKKLNWQPFYSSKKAIIQTIEWHRNKKKDVLKSYEYALDRYLKNFKKKINL